MRKKRSKTPERRSRKTGGPRTQSVNSGARLEALDVLIEETRLLFHRLRAVAEEIHEAGELTAGLRGVLQLLHRLGPRTVPQMARARSVARQHIQILVNRLLEKGYVELRDNPEHRRSSLVGLTPQGEEAFEAMRERETSLLARLPLEASREDLERAAGVLRSLRKSMESPAWRRLLEEREPKSAKALPKGR